MFSLLMSTISLGLVDSLNPFGVSMQFVLQGLVKKPRDIWYYISATALTNFAGGLLAYFGLLSILSNIYNYFLGQYQPFVITLELVLAFILGVLAAYQIITPLIEKQIEEATDYEFEEDASNIKVKSVSPTSLILIGTGAAVSELSTAFPYFAFLAVLFNYELSLPIVIGIMIFYNILYASPLIVLYFVYKFANKQFDRLYSYIHQLIERFSSILSPVLLGILSAVLIYHSVIQIL